MAIRVREYNEPLGIWAAQQTQPFSLEDAIYGAGLIPPGGDINSVNASTVRRTLKRVGYRPNRQYGQGIKWWRITEWPPPMSLEDRVHGIVALRVTLDRATADLVEALDGWEQSLVTRQDAPPPPVDTAEIFKAGRAQGRQEREAEIPPPPPVIDHEAVFSAGQQEGRQQREAEILVLLGQQLALLREGTQGYLQLWALKNAITGSNK